MAGDAGAARGIHGSAGRGVGEAPRRRVGSVAVKSTIKTGRAGRLAVGAGESPPPPAPRLSRFLVRYVPGDHLVHSLARMPKPFFAYREIDDGDSASRGDALHFFARH